MCVPRPRDGVCALHTRRACVKYPCHLPMADTAQLAHALAMHALRRYPARVSRSMYVITSSEHTRTATPQHGGTPRIRSLSSPASLRVGLSLALSRSHTAMTRRAHLTVPVMCSSPLGAVVSVTLGRSSRPSVSSTLSSLASARRPRSVCRAFHAACGVCHAHW